MYWRLSCARTRWVGWAIDSATNGFEGYEMEVVIKDVSDEIMGQLAVGGVCRWRSVGDCLTKISGMLTPGASMENTLKFVEHTLIRGPPGTIALPNTYKAKMFGSVLLGVYDPGRHNPKGAFGLVMEECIVPTPMSSPLSDGWYFGHITHTRLYSPRPCRLWLGSGKGIFTVEPYTDIMIVNPTAVGSYTFQQPETEDREDSWWEGIKFTGPEGSVDFKRVGNVVLGLFKEPSEGVFYVRSCEV